MEDNTKEVHEKIKALLLKKLRKEAPGHTLDRETSHILDLVAGQIILKGYNEETAEDALKQYEKEMQIIEKAKKVVPESDRCPRAEFDQICDNVSAMVVDKIRDSHHMPDPVREMFWATAQYLPKKEVRGALEAMFKTEYKKQCMEEAQRN